ncbi:MAG: dockerin type I repeat-containing protein [Dehalobacterium sp.]|jgi:hypothetical protein
MRCRVFVPVLLLLTFFLPLTALASGIPPIPSVYKGSVKDQNGEPVAAGTVNAYTNDILRGSVEFTDGSYDKLLVQGDSESHLAIVKFTVTVRNVELDAVSNQEVKWRSGRVSGIDFAPVNLTVDLSSLPSLLPGDVNMDGVVNIFDVQMTINFVMERVSPNTMQFESSDVDGNRTLNIFDVVHIINIIMER